RNDGVSRRLVLGAAATTLSLTTTRNAHAMTLQPHTPHNGHARLDGLDVSYEIHGGPLESGVEPLVLLHGGVMAIETSFAGRWLSKLAALGRPVIAIEQMGHGHTGVRPGPFTVDRMVADTIGVLDH